MPLNPLLPSFSSTSFSSLSNKSLQIRHHDCFHLANLSIFPKPIDICFLPGEIVFKALKGKVFPIFVTVTKHIADGFLFAVNLYSAVGYFNPFNPRLIKSFSEIENPQRWEIDLRSFGCVWNGNIDLRRIECSKIIEGKS